MKPKGDLRSYNRLIVFVSSVFAAGIVLANFVFLIWPDDSDRFYHVEANRLIDKYSATGEITAADIASCQRIKGIEELTSLLPSDMQRFIDDSGYDNRSFVRPLYYNGQLKGYVKFFYTDDKTSVRSFAPLQNAVFLLMFTLCMGVLFYLKYTVIKPLNAINAFPEALAKGDLITPFHERNGRFFNKFFWGLDMLRETLLSERQRVLAIEKEKAQTALSLSHEIKTPLGAIMLCAKALQEDLFQGAERRNELLTKIVKHSWEIQALVVSLQAGASEIVPDLPVEDGEFYLDEIIHRADEAYRWRMKLTRTQFRIDSHPNLLLRGDADRAFQALCNLLENAMKYGDGELISIELSREEDCQLVTVANSGNSLSSEESVHIFQSFWRGSNAQGKPGNGLGLFIARRLCVKMGGEAYAFQDGDLMRVTLVFRTR
ncbi:MAG: HAMP domain-containing histidine kinase [Peptococcaceae bacterium]|nr:HAMP domain-containing histidine kinase [Peptococcaceae bacterium]